MNERLTGLRRYRVDAEGRLILQVQVVPRMSSPPPANSETWRDARVEDLTLHERPRG